MKLLITLLLISSVSYAKITPPEDSPSKEELFCVEGFYKNELIKTYFQSSNMNLFNFFLKVKDYCNCDSSNIREENKEREKDWTSFAFKDRTSNLIKKDLCAVKSFDTETELNLFYAHNFYSLFSDVISNRIKDQYMGNSIIKIAGEQKWGDYLECSSTLISNKCSKIKSLALTYSCIKDSFDVFTYDNIHRECLPNLHDFNGLLLNKEDLI